MAAGSAAGQRRQLPVDLDPQRLEGALGRVPAGTPGRGRDRVPDQLDQPRRRGDRLRRAGSRDGLGDPPGEPLLAVLPQHPGQLVHRVAVDDVGRGRPGRRHPHVQRRVLRVREAAPGLVQLQRGHPEVEQHPVDPGHPGGGEHGRDLVVHGLVQRDPRRRTERAARRPAAAPPGPGRSRPAAARGAPPAAPPRARPARASRPRRPSRAGERGREQREHPVPKDRHVRRHPAHLDPPGGCRPRDRTDPYGRRRTPRTPPARRRLTPGK